MEHDLRKYRSKLDELKGEAKSIKRDIESKEEELVEIVSEREDSIEARIHLQEVSKQTLSKLKLKIEEIVTLALKTIITDQDYSLDVDVYTKANRPQCALTFMKRGRKTHPLEDEGFGAVNIASFALRLAMWSISTPKTDNVLVIDEPFKDLSAEYKDDAFAFMKEMSHKLNIQIICVTHEDGLKAQSDRLFNFKLKEEEMPVGQKIELHDVSSVTVIDK